VYTPGHTNTNKSVLSKEVSKSNFRQYGQMKSRDGKNQKRREEKRREEVESVASGALFEVEMSKKWTPL
jgi:hypothetical protein